MKLPLRKYFLDGAGEGEGGGVGIESTQQRGDQVITLSQQGLTFVENFPDSAMNGLTIDQKAFVPPEKQKPDPSMKYSCDNPHVQQKKDLEYLNRTF